ncbi:MAG TPA: hypothetical protein VME86_10595 [Acidobacteriaceae bacterium]|nr:hypothetical protein [Acidobacteriaceae bacterium]
MRFGSIALFAAVAGLCALGSSALTSSAQTQAATPSRIVGSVTAVNGQSLIVKPDKGAPVTLTVGDNARILETQPGAKTLAGATPIQISGISVGDRILAAVHPSANGSSLTATVLICMKQTAIAQRQQAEEAAWQREGIGGLVKSVDPASGTIIIATGPRTIVIRTTPSTTFRRYSPDSIKFADSVPSTIAAIHPGDQLRARGPHAPGASDLTADVVVSGTFRNISATVISVDPAANTVTVRDLATKKPVVIHINAESQLHKLPPSMAEHLAMLFKHPGNHPAGADHTAEEHAQYHMPPGATGANGNAHAGDNLTRMLASTPTLQISDLHKGDAVMIVATLGTPGSATAVALVAGVEPILTAAPSASQSMFSASWNVGGNSEQAAGETGTP